MTRSISDSTRALRKLLDGPGFTFGRGSTVTSVQAVERAFGGSIPDSVSPVVVEWLRQIHPILPARYKHIEWKDCLVEVPASSWEDDSVRAEWLVEWIWHSVMPGALPIADRAGIGRRWRECLRTRSVFILHDSNEDIMREGDIRAQLLIMHGAFAGEKFGAGAQAAVNVLRYILSSGGPDRAPGVWPLADPVVCLWRLVHPHGAPGPEAEL